jgi:hypothetical protein
MVGEKLSVVPKANKVVESKREVKKYLLHEMWESAINLNRRECNWKK